MKYLKYNSNNMINAACDICEPILNLIYPRRCPVCQGIVDKSNKIELNKVKVNKVKDNTRDVDRFDINENNPRKQNKKQNIKENIRICKRCEDKLVVIPEPQCMKCGKPVDVYDQEYCLDCERLKKHFVRGFPLYEYTDVVKQGVLAMKYNNRREYAQYYSESMLARYYGEWKRIGFDGIIPVPIHKKKLRIRGYNQAELLARPIARALEVPLYTKELIRIQNTAPQKQLNDVERMENLKKAFFFRENDVKLNKVLLVDDIYTSGATIEACTQALMRAGVREVYYTSVCIGKGY